MNSNGTELERVVHTHRTGAVGLVNWIPVLAPEYSLPSQWISVVTPTFHFRHGPNTCSLCAKLWHRTYPICDAPLWKSARRSLVRSQKSRWNHCSYVLTEALSAMIFVPLQELSCVMRTLFFSFLFLVRYHPLYFQRSGGAARVA